jgi:membrane fusion protein (multidrug efflux system)
MRNGKERAAGVTAVSVVLWLVVVLAVVLVVVLAILKPEKEEIVVPLAKAVPVRVLAVQARTVSDTVTLPGQVAADSSARLAAEKPGRVVELAADKGDTVRKGQVLLRLDDRQWKVLQRQARTELETAERDLARWEQMKAGGSVADSEYDAIRQRRDLAAASAEAAAVHVDQCTLASPMDGVVDARLVEVGEYVNDGQGVFQVLDLTPLKVQVSLPEKDTAVVRVGDDQRITSPSLPGVAWTGIVHFVAQEASPGTFSYPSELIIKEAATGLRPGMIVDVHVERAVREGVVAVPLAALIPRRGEHVVYVVQSGIAVRRVVALDSIIGEEAVLGGGLKPGELLVIEGHRGLQDGVAVQVVDDREQVM